MVPAVREAPALRLPDALLADPGLVGGPGQASAILPTPGMPRPCIQKPTSGENTVSAVAEGGAAEASTPRKDTQRSVLDDDKADLVEALGEASQGLSSQGLSSQGEWTSERSDKGGEGGGKKSKNVIFADLGALPEEQPIRPPSKAEPNDSGEALGALHSDAVKSYLTSEEHLMDVPSLLKKRTSNATQIFRETDQSYVDLLVAALGTSNEEFLVKKRTSELRHSDGVRGLCYRASTNMLFQCIFGFLLGVNVLLLAFEADVNVHRAMYPEEDAWAGFVSFQAVSEHVFTFLFSLEILIRLIGCPKKPWRDGWLVADGVIVLLSIVDNWILAIATQADGNMSSLSIFRVGRLLRAVRALRVVRLFRYIQSLRVVAEALGEALRHTLWLIVIVFVTNWCMSVILVSSVNIWKVNDWDPTDPSDWQTSQEMPHVVFQHMGACLMMLELVMPQAIPWGFKMLHPLVINRSLVYKLVAVVLAVFVCALTLWLANVIRGIFIDSLIKAVEQDNSSAYEKSLMSGEVSVKELKMYFGKFDYDSIGLLRVGDLKKGVKDHPKFCTVLGVDPGCVETLFRQLDLNRDGFVSLDEFLIGCLKFRDKLVGMTRLIQEYNFMKMNANLYVLGRRYDRDFKLTTHNVHNIHCKMDTLQLCFQQLVEEVASEDEERDARISAFFHEQSHMSKSFDNQVLIDLEERYSFRKRFDALTDHTKAAAQELHDSAEGRRGGLERSMLTVLKGVWQDVVFQEALPWVREHLKDVHTKVPTDVPPGPEPANIPPGPEPAKDLPPTTSGWMLRQTMLKRIDRDSVLYASKPRTVATMSL